MSVKITGLTALNVQALREVSTLVEREPEFVLVLRATTAQFLDATPTQALAWVEATISRLPGRQHPKASLYAVARKLRAQVLGGRQDVPADPAVADYNRAAEEPWKLAAKPAAPVAEKCRNTGVTHPRRLRSKCRDCGKEGAVTGAGILRAHQPLELTVGNFLNN